MEPKRNCTERMRQILQAMERSIDAARKSRTGQNTAPAAPPRYEPPRPAFASASPAIPFAAVPATAPADQSPPRLKARPKRFDTPLVNPFEKLSYRTQTG